MGSVYYVFTNTGKSILSFAYLFVEKVTIYTIYIEIERLLHIYYFAAMLHVAGKLKISLVNLGFTSEHVILTSK